MNVECQHRVGLAHKIIASVQMPNPDASISSRTRGLHFGLSPPLLQYFANVLTHLFICTKHKNCIGSSEHCLLADAIST